MNRQFQKKYRANKFVNRCPASLVIKVMQIKQQIVYDKKRWAKSSICKCVGNRLLSYMSGKHIDWLNLFEELKILKMYGLFFVIFILWIVYVSIISTIKWKKIKLFSFCKISFFPSSQLWEWNYIFFQIRSWTASQGVVIAETTNIYVAPDWAAKYFHLP